MRLQSDFIYLVTMSYNQTVDYWFSCLNYVGMNPTKPKNYYGVIIITTSATLLAILALLDMLVNPDEKDAFVTLSVLVQVFYQY